MMGLGLDAAINVSVNEEGRMTAQLLGMYSSFIFTRDICL
jgi:hypothetical protein